MKKRTIVISAVNLNNGGTLTILRDCLAYLSSLAAKGEFKVIAIVHQKELAFFPNIQYIENQWPKKRWINRIWFEYVSMHKISKQISPVYLWFSLHDTTPNVIADKIAVYCHSPFAFYKARWRELFFTPKIVLFSWFTKYIYQVNQTKNDYIVVQQQWFKDAMLRMFNVSPSKIIIAPPEVTTPVKISGIANSCQEYSFLFASSPNSHKNFELLCKAVEILENKNVLNFKVLITVKGDENEYAKWLHKKWGYLQTLKFIGFLNQDQLYAIYEETNCLIFPSKVETWGLPISEFSVFRKPMLLADLPYAYETASGAHKVAYFNPDSAEQLAYQMERLLNGDENFLAIQETLIYQNPKAENWQGLFEILLAEKK